MLQQLKLDFWRICAFPSAVGAIDCTHAYQLKIQCPRPGSETAELFRNRYGYFSVSVQAVCGPNLEMLNIVAWWLGVHDARILYVDSSNVVISLGPVE
jgi:hypothetical protein